MYDAGRRSGLGVYAIGTQGGIRCDPALNPTGVVPTDGQVWSLLAGADASPKRKQRSLEFVLRKAPFYEPVDWTSGLLTVDQDVIGNKDGVGKYKKYTGVRFTPHGHGIQWEF